VDVVSGKPYPELHDSVDLIKLPGLNLYERDERLGAFDPSFLLNPNDLFEWFSVNTGGFPEPYTFGNRVVRFLNQSNKEYDIIHDNQSLSYGVESVQAMGYPVVTTIHHPITIDRQLELNNTTDFFEKLLVRRWYNFLSMQKSVAKSLDQIICVSESSRRKAQEDFGISRENTSVVHNGIDAETFNTNGRSEEGDLKLITTASADVPLKGLKYLLKSLTKLLPDHPNLELTVIGELRDQGETQELIQKLNLENRVQFHSQITQKRIVELYSDATVAVCPSLYEGFGFPAGEAMACEVPLVTTDGGALPEVVGDCAEIVEPGNPNALADGIRTLLDNPAKRKRLAERARKRITDQFTWEKAAKQTETVYREAIANADRRR
jgi:glycosyltransferase involved in cell wall biosynthesis